MRSLTCAGAAPDTVADAQHSSAETGFVGNEETSAELRASRPWLMPHQTGDRKAGAAAARAVNSARTPIGSFAVFDLAKAPK